MDALTILKTIVAIGPTLLGVPEVRSTIEAAISVIGSIREQDELFVLLAGFAEDNDAGFARLQAKLEAAAKL